MRFMTMAFVYMLTNQWHTALYVGSTADLIVRLRLHRDRKFDGFSKKYNVDKLVYYEATGTLEEARVREYQLKRKNRSRKNELIETFNPNWIDLSNEHPFLRRSRGTS